MRAEKKVGSERKHKWKPYYFRQNSTDTVRYVTLYFYFVIIEKSVQVISNLKSELCNEIRPGIYIILHKKHLDDILMTMTPVPGQLLNHDYFHLCNIWRDEAINDLSRSELKIHKIRNDDFRG
jgi:hypothetical protein